MIWHQYIISNDVQNKKDTMKFVVSLLQIALFATAVFCDDGDVTTTEAPAPNTTTTPGGWTPDPACPYPSDVYTYYPYPGDCTKFIECYQGIKYVEQCPGDERWNQAILSCDYASNVPCDDNTTTPTEAPTKPTTPEPTTTEPPTTTTTTEEPTTTEAPTTVEPTTEEPTTEEPQTTNTPPVTTTTQAPWTPDPLCPYPSDQLVLLPDPYDCTKYYVCAEGNRFVMKCPDGERWNQNLQTCDFASNVECIEISTTTPDPAFTTTAGPTTTSNETTTVGPSTTTPSSKFCHDLETGTLLPDPECCNRFIECTNGLDISLPCSNGLYWNDNAKKCDYLVNATCDDDWDDDHCFKD